MEADATVASSGLATKDKAASWQVRSFWPSLLGGVALGMVLLLAFLLTGHGLGASGFMVRLAAWLGGKFAPGVTRGNEYLGPLLESGHSLSNWIT